jgi:hypothetical protein
MVDHIRGRDLCKLCVYAAQERDPATISEAEAATERERMLGMRAVLLDEGGLASEPNPTVQVEDDGKAAF